MPVPDVYIFEHLTPFCANEACALHVRSGDKGVSGGGNWVKLKPETPDETIIGRQLVDGRLVCGMCATGRSVEL